MWFLFATTSALLSATAAILEKKTLFKCNALIFSFLLAVANLVLSVPFFMYADFSPVSNATLGVVAFKSFMGAVSFLLVMNGIKRLELSSALPLLVLTPGLVAVFAWLMLGDSLAGAEMAGLVLLLVGTYMLQVGQPANLLKPFYFGFRNRAYLFIAGAVFIFTITSLIDKWLLASYRVQPETYLPLQHLFMAFFFLVFVLFSKIRTTDLVHSAKPVWKWVLVIAVLTIAYRYSHIWAIKTGAVALALSVKRTSVFFAAVIGGTIFKEKHVPYKALATAVMIAGAVLVILK